MLIGLDKLTVECWIKIWLVRHPRPHFQTSKWTHISILPFRIFIFLCSYQIRLFLYLNYLNGLEVVSVFLNAHFGLKSSMNLTIGTLKWLHSLRIRFGRHEHTLDSLVTMHTDWWINNMKGIIIFPFLIFSKALAWGKLIELLGINMMVWVHHLCYRCRGQSTKFAWMYFKFWLSFLFSLRPVHGHI